MPHVRLYVDGLRLGPGALASWGRPEASTQTAVLQDQPQTGQGPGTQKDPWDGRACQLPLRAVPASASADLVSTG